MRNNSDYFVCLSKIFEINIKVSVLQKYMFLLKSSDEFDTVQIQRVWAHHIGHQFGF